jgi:hypothetical protein
MFQVFDEVDDGFAVEVAAVGIIGVDDNDAVGLLPAYKRDEIFGVEFVVFFFFKTIVNNFLPFFHKFVVRRKSRKNDADFFLYKIMDDGLYGFDGAIAHKNIARVGFDGFGNVLAHIVVLRRIIFQHVFQFTRFNEVIVQVLQEQFRCVRIAEKAGIYFNFNVGYLAQDGGDAGRVGTALLFERFDLIFYLLLGFHIAR